jgi:diguanylate cyclase (GGDEF)-like protein
MLLSMALTMAVGLVLTAVVFGVSAYTIRTMADRVSTTTAIEEATQTLQRSLIAQEAFAFDYALSGREEILGEYDAASADDADAYLNFQTEARAYPDLIAAVDAAHAAASAWRDNWAGPFLRTAFVTQARPGIAATASKRLFLPAETALDALDAQVAQLRAETVAQVRDAISGLAIVIAPLGITAIVLLALLGMSLTRSISGPLRRLNLTTEALVAGEQVTFRPERDDELGALADVLERLRVDAAGRSDRARIEGEQTETFDRLAELTSFARDEAELVSAASRAIRRLVPATAGDILLANPSQNRLTVGVAWGDDAPDTGTLVSLDRMDRCPGIRRSSAFVAADVAEDMAVRCPAHPSAVGTVACLPMLALGKIVGVIHLASAAAHAFDAESIGLVTRVAETVGLAMANARLMQTMEGQAMSDSLTGLPNTRFFDPYLERELESARRDEQPLSVIMVDIDHFKTFNDTYGHPAGDEALRTFAKVVGGSIRASDVAARYGGEEFIIALRHAGLDEAQVIAEKLRAAVEQTIVELGPGRFARITASFGVASTGAHVHDQKALVSLADAALYRAKEGGRNRVEVAPAMTVDAALGSAAQRRRRLASIALPPADRTSA